MLLANGLNAIRWIGGSELELLAIATNGRIVPRFEDLTPDKLGTAGVIRELEFGTTKDRMLVIEECSNTKSRDLLYQGIKRNDCCRRYQSITRFSLCCS